MTLLSLLDGAAGRPGVGSSGTQPPSSVAGYSGPLITGTVFQCTTGGNWLWGYDVWVPPGGDTGPQEFALQCPSASAVGTYVPGTLVTSGPLTAGVMNRVLLADPVQVAIATPYVAQTGWTVVSGFPFSSEQFGNFGAATYVDGITNAQLYGYSDSTNGGNPPSSPDGCAQGVFSVGLGTDPSAAMAFQGSNSGLFWISPVIGPAPPGYAGSFSIWPNKYDTGIVAALDTAANYIVATEFTLTEACTLDHIGYYSPPTAVQLATQCAIWDVTTQAMVPGTLKTSPGWSGAAGSGNLLSSAYSGVTLPAGDYKTSIWNGAASPSGFNAFQVGYFDGTGGGANGIVNGPITVPNTASSTAPGQSTYQVSGSTFLYPDLSVGNSQSYYVDVVVTPVAAKAGRSWSLPLFTGGL